MVASLTAIPNSASQPPQAAPQREAIPPLRDMDGDGKFTYKDLTLALEGLIKAKKDDPHLFGFLTAAGFPKTVNELAESNCSDSALATADTKLRAQIDGIFKETASPNFSRDAFVAEVLRIFSKEGTEAQQIRLNALHSAIDFSETFSQTFPQGIDLKPTDLGGFAVAMQKVMDDRVTVGACVRPRSK